VHLLASDQLNTYDVLVNDDVVFTSPLWSAEPPHGSSKATDKAAVEDSVEAGRLMPQ
jgi:hypothetical protein